MTLPTPTIGSTDVRAYVIDAPWNLSYGPVQGQTFECLESIYGAQSADGFNPLIFRSVVPTGLPYGTEVLIDIVAAPWDATTGVASNVRRA
jgi:hypothetical protein